MKLFKFALLPIAVVATSAYAQEQVVVVDQVQTPVTVSTTTYHPEAGVIKNTTTQLVSTPKAVFSTIVHPAAVSAEVGTLGYGANIAWLLSDKAELQAGWTGGDLSDIKDTIKFNDTEYDLETDFSNPYLGVQMRPMGNWFTIGAGTIVSDNKITLRKDANTTPVEINGRQYRGNIDATVENKNTMNPYLTIGFRPNLTNKFGVYGEVGAAYTGGLSVKEANANFTDVKGNVYASTDYPMLKSDLQKDLDDSDYSEWFPIAKLGLTYRF